MSYKASGVDIMAGNNFVKAIRSHVRETERSGSVSSIGGFAGLFDLKASGYIDPILVASTDGVGTKLLIAIETGKLGTIGVDLVAMCVNDIVVQGAEPLFFLDYYANSKLNITDSVEIIAGITEGCKQAHCALIGGETAEMPGLYKSGDFDLAGFCVGAVERKRLISGKNVKEGDQVIGLGSSGLHSNGYSLVRKIFEINKLDYSGSAPFDPNRSLDNFLLAPTRIYVKSCLAVAEYGGVHALAHITGGGLIENIPRILPLDLGVVIDVTAWQLPPMFKWLAEIGGIPANEMLRTFNCGIGMAVIVDPGKAKPLREILEEKGETVFEIGSVVKASSINSQIKIKNVESQWKN